MAGSRREASAGTHSRNKIVSTVKAIVALNIAKAIT